MCLQRSVYLSVGRLAREVAEEGGQLISASLTATPVFDGGATADDVIADYKEQLKPIMEEGVDFIICEVLTAVTLPGALHRDGNGWVT